MTENFEYDRTKVKEVTKCRICDNPSLKPMIDLGVQSLSGRFPLIEEPNPIESPLHLVKCDDSNNKYACGLLQLRHTTAPDEMYGETYGYRSGLNKTMTDHMIGMVRTIENLVNLKPGDAVLDIASSDGTLLNAYDLKLKRIGIDPSAEKFRKFYAEGIDIVVDYFSAEKFKKVTSKKAKAITCNAMFYDLDDPISFMKDVKEILHQDGIWVSEQSYMPEMLRTNSFDTICHEHLDYYALKQMEHIFKKSGLKLFDVDFNYINGTTFRTYACHEESLRKINIERIQSVRDNEKALKLDTDMPYKEFAERVISIRDRLSDFLRSERKKGKKIHLYGASTKGNIILNYLNIGKEIAEFASDRNPDKYGRRMLTHIPIIPEEESRKSNPDYYLVLPWCFKEEFIKREEGFLRKGGKLIFPLPQPEIIGINGERLLI